LLECALGARGGAGAQVDFPDLGIELKSLPVSPDGRPLESTYVCHAGLGASLEGVWEDSWLRRKLSCVLWVPVVAERGSPVGDRLVGTPLLWRPDATEEASLRTDWEELGALIRSGDLGRLDGRAGTVLQLRPKAANSRSTTHTLDEQAQRVAVNPRGFYLRRSFTHGLLIRHYRRP
jgi:DNA mismatch repair protein MutH